MEPTGTHNSPDQRAFDATGETTDLRTARESASSGVELLLHYAPRLVWIVGCHVFRDVCGLIAEIFLVDHTLLADKECHYTAGPIVGGIGDETEATGTWEHAVVIAVIGHTVAGGVIAFIGSLGNHGPGRALGFALFHLPIESILSAWFADDAGCVRTGWLSVVSRGRVVMLGGYYTFAHIDGCQLIVANAPVEDLILASLSIPVPLAALVGKWDRERPSYSCRPPV